LANDFSFGDGLTLNNMGLNPSGTVTDWGMRITGILGKATMQGLVQQAIGGQFKDGAVASLGSSLGEELGRSLVNQLDADLNASMSPAEASALKLMVRAFTAGVGKLATGGDANSVADAVVNTEVNGSLAGKTEEATPNQVPGIETDAPPPFNVVAVDATPAVIPPVDMPDLSIKTALPVVTDQKVAPTIAAPYEDNGRLDLGVDRTQDVVAPSPATVFGTGDAIVVHSIDDLIDGLDTTSPSPLTDLLTPAWWHEDQSMPSLKDWQAWLTLELGADKVAEIFKPADAASDYAQQQDNGRYTYLVLPAKPGDPAGAPMTLPSLPQTPPRLC
jgi:hypothetical protein